MAMFGKRSTFPTAGADAPAPARHAPSAAPKPALVSSQPKPTSVPANTQVAPAKSDDYYATKSVVFTALIEAIDLSQLSRLQPDAARDEIRDIVNEIIAIKNLVLSISEQEEIIDDICNDVLGYGPLEPLLARDDIADIMVNGAAKTYIEVGGKIQLTNVRFRDNSQLMNICQRIVSQVGRRVDEASPICDARLADDDAFGSHTQAVAHEVAHGHRAGALEVRRPRLETHDVRLLELQFRRVLAGDDALVAVDVVREAVEQRRLARARATGDQHVAAHAADDLQDLAAFGRDRAEAHELVEGELVLAELTNRESGPVEGEVIITQDLFVYELDGEDKDGRIIGHHKSTGIGRPRFWERARYYGEEGRLAAALDAAEDKERPRR